MSSEVTLSEATLDAIAERVVERMQSTRPEPPRLLDAAEAAARLGTSTDFVYRHAADLGARRMGSGKRPRLRFAVADLDRFAAASQEGAGSLSKRSQGARSPGPKRKAPRRQARPIGQKTDLLPIRGEHRG